MLGVPRCFDDQTAEAAAAMGSLIAGLTPRARVPRRRRRQTRQFTRYLPKLVGIASWDLYLRRPPPLLR